MSTTETDEDVRKRLDESLLELRRIVVRKLLLKRRLHTRVEKLPSYHTTPLASVLVDEAMEREKRSWRGLLRRLGRLIGIGK